MATLHRDFAEALNDWRQSGGAMCHEGFTGSDPEGWWVGMVDEILEMCPERDDAKTLTRDALLFGGKTPAEADAMLADWQD